MPDAGEDTLATRRYGFAGVECVISNHNTGCRSVPRVVRGAWCVEWGLELKKLVFRAMGDLSTQAGGELAWVLALVMLSMILLSVVLLSVILLSVVLRSLSLFVLMHITKQMILPFINRCT